MDEGNGELPLAVAGVLHVRPGRLAAPLGHLQAHQHGPLAPVAPVGVDGRIIMVSPARGGHVDGGGGAGVGVVGGGGQADAVVGRVVAGGDVVGGGRTDGAAAAPHVKALRDEGRHHQGQDDQEGAEHERRARHQLSHQRQVVGGQERGGKPIIDRVSVVDSSTVAAAGVDGRWGRKGFVRAVDGVLFGQVDVKEYILPCSKVGLYCLEF